MSKKGYVPNRLPGANQVAASLNKSFNGCYFYVEGASDTCMWRNFLDEDNVKIIACGGWENVIDSAKKNVCKNNLCIGVVDLDFHSFIPQEKKNDPNIFLTDDHDLEMMIYHSGDYQKAINVLDAHGKRKEYEDNNHSTVLEEVMVIVDKIARLRMTAIKNDLKIVFRKRTKDNEFSYPEYDKILDKHSFSYISDEKLIKYILDWSRNVTKTSLVYGDVHSLMDQIESENFDKWQFLNGHDITLVLYILLKKKVKISALNNSDSFEKSLYVAYEKESLQRTKLYSEIQDFAIRNSLMIFK